jgi:hypothetical protein
MIWKNFQEFSEYLEEKGFYLKKPNGPFFVNLKNEELFIALSYYNLYLYFSEDFKTDINFQLKIKKIIDFVIPEVAYKISYHKNFGLFTTTPANTISYFNENRIFQRHFTVMSVRVHIKKEDIKSEKRFVVSECMKKNELFFDINERDCLFAKSLNSKILVIPYCLQFIFDETFEKKYPFYDTIFRYAKILLPNDAKIISK